jgi:hypothetical protein
MPTTGWGECSNHCSFYQLDPPEEVPPKLEPPDEVPPKLEPADDELELKLVPVDALEEPNEVDDPKLEEVDE